MGFGDILKKKKQQNSHWGLPEPGTQDVQPILNNTDTHGGLPTPVESANMTLNQENYNKSNYPRRNADDTNEARYQKAAEERAEKRAEEEKRKAEEKRVRQEEIDRRKDKLKEKLSDLTGMLISENQAKNRALIDNANSSDLFKIQSATDKIESVLKKLGVRKQEEKGGLPTISKLADTNKSSFYRSKTSASGYMTRTGVGKYKINGIDSSVPLPSDSRSGIGKVKNSFQRAHNTVNSLNDSLLVNKNKNQNVIGNNNSIMGPPGKDNVWGYTGEMLVSQAVNTVKNIGNKIADVFRTQMHQNDNRSFAAAVIGDDEGLKYLAESEKKNKKAEYDQLLESAKKNNDAISKIQRKYSGTELYKRQISDLFTSTVNSLPAVIPYVGMPLFFANAARQSEEEAVLEGATFDQARVYGVLNGGKEVAIEKTVGGIPNINGVFDKGAEKLADYMFKSNIGKETFIKLYDIAGEGLEEVNGDIGSTLIKRAIYNPYAEMPTEKDLAWSFAGGAVGSVILSAPSDIYKAAKYKQLPKAIDNFNKAVDAIPEKYRDGISKLDSKSSTLSDFNRAVNEFEFKSAMARTNIETDTATAERSFYQNILADVKNQLNNVHDDKTINTLSETAAALEKQISAVDDYLNDLYVDKEKYKNAEKTGNEIQNKNVRISDAQAISPTHIDMAIGTANANGFVNAVLDSNGTYRVTSPDGIVRVKNIDQFNNRYISIDSLKNNLNITESTKERVLSKKADSEKTAAAQQIAIELNRTFENSPENINDNINQNKIENAVSNLTDNIISYISRKTGSEADGNTWTDVYNSSLKYQSSPGNAVDINYVRSFADAFVDMMAASNKIGYKALKQYSDNASQLLTELTVGKNSIAADNRFVQDTVKNFKTLLISSVEYNNRIKNSIYSNGHEFANIQAEQIKRGDFSSISYVSNNLNKNFSYSVKENGGEVYGRDIYSDRNLGRKTGEGSKEQAQTMESRTGETQTNGEIRQANRDSERFYGEDESVVPEVENRVSYGRDVRMDNRYTTKIQNSVRADFVHSDAYTPEMMKIAESNSKKGLQTEFFIGEADIGNDEKARGVIIGNKKILIQADNAKYSPEMINKHELVHRDYNTKNVQRLVNIIRNSLSVSEKNYIIKDLYSHYYEIANGNEQAIFEEFIADVLSGMNTYGHKFDELVSDNNETMAKAENSYNAGTYTRSVDSGGKYSVEINNISRQISDWMNGKMKPYQVFEFGKTPDVIVNLGAERLPVIMTQDVMKKITKDKHNVTIDNVKNLYSAISEPIMVFNSNAVPNAYVILTDLKDGAGDSVIAAMHLSRKQNRIVVNRIASVYGKENVNNFVIKQINKGNLKYADNKKSQQWLTSRGLQLPKLVQDIADKVMMNSSSYGINISQDNRNVNTNYMQNNSKYLHEKNKILDNKNIQKNETGLRRGEFTPNPGTVKNRTGRPEVGFNNINISQDNKNVNSNYMQNNSEYTHRENELSDNENIQKKKTKNKYSISYNEDGSPAYVEITENIFIGHKGENANKVIRNYLKQHIGEYAKIIESGQKIYLGKDLPGEYLYSKNSTKNNRSIKYVKNQATQNLGEMIEIATNRRWEKPFHAEKHRNDAKYGFYKYDTKFKVGDSFYNADILIRNSENGKKYLYDIINIKKITARREANASYLRTSENRGTDISETSNLINNNISQNDNIDNTHKQTSKDNKYSIENSEAKNETDNIRNSVIESIEAAYGDGKAFEFNKADIKNINKLIDNAFNNKANIKETSENVAKYIIENAKIKSDINEEAKADYDFLRKYISNKINITDSLDAELDARYGDRKAVYKRLFGGGDQSTDTVYSELSSKMADYFPDNISSDYDQMIKIIDVYEQLKAESVKTKTEKFSEFLDKQDRADIIDFVSEYLSDSVNAHISLNDKVVEYDAIPKGEKPARDVDVPKKISEKQYVSRFARTMVEAGVTPDSYVSEFEKKILDGTMAYERVTDNSAKKYSDNILEEKGVNKSIEYWNDLVKSGMKINKNNMALGQTLYAECVKNKDTVNAMKIAADLSILATEAGQAAQSLRLLKQMSPDGQVYVLEKTVSKMNKEFEKKLGKKYEKIKLNEDLIKEYFEADSDKKRSEALDKIQVDIARQIPTTFVDKWNSWRYIAMLGNPRTHIRNIVGNAVFIPAIEMKNAIGTILEKGVKKSERTKSILKTKESKIFANKDFEKVASTVSGGNSRYEVTEGIEGKREIFKFKPIEILRKKNFEFLEKEDVLFLKRAYVSSFAGAMTARKLSSDFLESGLLEANRELEKLRNYASIEAQKATYRDANSLASALNSFQRKAENSKNIALKSGGILMEGVLPFKKTPMNILKRGIEYSPAGLINGTSKLLTKVRKGEINATEAIDDIAKGLTGSAIMALGMWLSNLGLIAGSPDDENKKANFDKLQGAQKYSLVIGKHTYTIDWMAPVSLPLFVGVETMKLFENDKYNFSDIMDSISAIAEPMTELSMLQGLSGILTTAKYDTENPFTAVIASMVSSYFSQAVPTLFGQIARSIDDTKRDAYYIDKNSKLPKVLNRFIQQTEAKIPFASYLLQPKVDNWGRIQKYNENPVIRTLQNFISPGYYSKIESSDIDKELNELYKRTGENDILPSNAPKYITKSKVRTNLTGSQYTEYSQLRGQRAFKYVSDVIGADDYKELSDEEKVKRIRAAYKKAYDEAKKEMINRINGNDSEVSEAEEEVSLTKSRGSKKSTKKSNTKKRSSSGGKKSGKSKSTAKSKKDYSKDTGSKGTYASRNKSVSYKKNTDYIVSNGGNKSVNTKSSENNIKSISDKKSSGITSGGALSSSKTKTNATDTVKKSTVAFKTIELKRPSSEFSKKTNQKLGKVSERAKSELERLSRDGNQILPKYDDYESIKIGNKTVTMKASVEKYKSISKTIASKTVNTLLSTSQYQKANEKTKVSMINKVYELSSELAKAQLMKSYKLDGESAIFAQTAKNYGNLPEFVIRQFA